MKKRWGLSVAVLAVLTFLAIEALSPAWGAPSFDASAIHPPGSGFTGVFMYHNDNQRTGQNLNETVLTPAGLNAATFGLLFTDSVDGQIYTQPLYVPNVTIPSMGTHNVIFVATELDSVYAFDADAGGDPLWHTSFTNPDAGITAVPSADTLSGDINPWVGITSTPVIDPATNTLYVLSKVKMPGPIYQQQLHALDITTGLERAGSPTTITATYPGAGDGSVGGVLTFDPLKQNDRPALTLANGIVYLAFASHGDHGPYHGWVLGYNASTLAQSVVWNDTPNGSEGGIWQSGCGAGVDSSGHLYMITGNGTFDVPPPDGPDWGDTFLKLLPGGGTLSVSDFFTPSDQQHLYQFDLDLGSGGNLLLPDQPGPHPHLMLSAGKEGTIYLLDRDSMGGFNSSSDQIVEELPFAIGGLFGTPAYWQGLVGGVLQQMVYFVGQKDVPKMFTLSGGQLSGTPGSQAAGVKFGFPGASPSISANGTTNGIMWAVDTSAYAVLGPAIVRAFDATDLSNQLYSSDQIAGDAPGPANKFAVPTIANGKVYVGTQTQVAVYGMLATIRTTPTATVSPTATLTPSPTATATATATPTATITPVASVLKAQPQSITFKATDFGDTGAQSKPVKVTVTNSRRPGGMPVIFGTPIASNGFIVSFNGCAGALGLGGQCVIQAEFVPTQIGIQSGTLQLIDNASNQPQVTLKGTGVSPSIQVRPQSINFGRLAQGGFTAPATVTLTNRSPVSVTIRTPTASAPFNVVENTCGQLAGGGGSCAIQIEFGPTTSGRFSGSLEIPDNAAGSPQSVKLSGTAK
ncbi:MAG TPA: choice-of-anchor D domain-containing protein [Candidatus Binataceae bacterium]|nr:choice-of-anchor D domain-containing protein [Candidatus Binataceae bacterium]